MENALAQIIDGLLKLVSRYLVAVWIVSGFLLFAPESFLEWFDLSHFEKENRHIVSLVFLFSFSADMVKRGGSWLRVVRKTRMLKKNIIERLHRLTENEKAILRPYITGNLRTRRLRYGDGIVKSLESLYILERASNIVDCDFCTEYVIVRFAREYLEKHQSLLE